MRSSAPFASCARALSRRGASPIPLTSRMRSLRSPMPQTALRSVLRVPQQPYFRFDTNDYSLDPRFAGRRVELMIAQREIIAIALDCGELCARAEGAGRRSSYGKARRARPRSPGLTSASSRCSPPRSPRASPTAGRAGSRQRASPRARPSSISVRACLAGQRVAFATATEWVGRLGDAKRRGTLEAELRRLSFIPLIVVDEVGYILWR